MGFSTNGDTKAYNNPYMQIVKQKKTRRVDASSTTSVEEYIMPESSISGTTAIIYGRYPEKGFAVNTLCHELALVLSGNGFISTTRKKTPIELGDCILIQPNEKFYWDGHMAVFIVCTPKWKPQQHKIIDGKPS